MKKVALDDMIELGFQHARTVLIEFKQPGLVPAFSILRQDHTVDIIGTPWSNDEEKKEALGYIKKYIREKNALAYCVVGEAWSATYNQAELGPNFVPPVKSDKRIEVVIAVAADRRGHKIARSHEIIRGDDGSVIDFAKDETQAAYTDMAGLFDD